MTGTGTTMSGNGTITKTGQGIVDWWGSSSTVTTSIKNFTGLIDVEGGTLANQDLDWNAAAGCAGLMTLNVGANGIFDMSTPRRLVNKLTGSGIIADLYAPATFSPPSERREAVPRLAARFQNTVPSAGTPNTSTAAERLG